MKKIEDLKIKTLEGLSVKNYQTFPSREWGEDGGMQADVYLNDKYVCRIFNAGDGGEADIYFATDANIMDFKTACFNFLNRKDKSFFKYDFMPKQAKDMKADDCACAVDLMATFYNGKSRKV